MSLRNTLSQIAIISFLLNTGCTTKSAIWTKGFAEIDIDCWIVDNHVWWSPNGERLVVYSSCNGWQGAQVVTMNPDGSDPVNITNNKGSNLSPEWSPDGTKIVFYSNLHGEDTTQLYGAYDIYTITIKRDSLKRLTDSSGRDGGPLWSPSGDKIAFYSNRDGDTEIYTMNINGSDQKRLTIRAGWDWPMDWSPIENKLLAYGTNGEHFGIYTIDLDDRSIEFLSDPDSNDEQPAYSPDGNEIIYLSSRNSLHMIMIMNADGSNKRIISESTEHMFDQPTFSNDGTQIGYSIGNVVTTAEERLWRTVVIADRDGSNARFLRGGKH